MHAARLLLAMGCAVTCGSHGPHDPSGTTDDAMIDPDATHVPGDGAAVHAAAIE